ncbi:MAG: permease [Gammaproteobacteria bacterium]|nr:permease [Gammaproteobacteria bacterium]
MILNHLNVKAPFLVLGRVGLDLYADPPGSKIIDATHFVADLGGSAGNIAVALAKAGADVGMISGVSSDPVGARTLHKLREYGVDTRHIIQAAHGYSNTLAITESINAPEIALYRNQAADLQIDDAQIDAIDWSNIGTLVITGSALGASPSREATLLALDLAKQHGVTTIFDLDYRAAAWPSPECARAQYQLACELSDLVVGNDDEIAVCSDTKGATVLEKRGAEGSILHTSPKPMVFGTLKVDALKPFGAGDAFLGTLLATLAMGRDWPTAIERGSAAAAYVVSTIGCASAIPTPDQLDAFMLNHGAR